MGASLRSALHCQSGTMILSPGRLPRKPTLSAAARKAPHPIGLPAPGQHHIHLVSWSVLPRFPPSQHTAPLGSHHPALPCPSPLAARPSVTPPHPPHPPAPLPLDGQGLQRGSGSIIISLIWSCWLWVVVVWVQNTAGERQVRELTKYRPGRQGWLYWAAAQSVQSNARRCSRSVVCLSALALSCCPSHPIPCMGGALHPGPPAAGTDSTVIHYLMPPVLLLSPIPSPSPVPRVPGR